MGLRQQAADLQSRSAQARASAQGYQAAAVQLTEAANILAATLSSLVGGQVVSGVGMLASAMRGRRTGRRGGLLGGPGATSSLPMMLLQTGQLRRADDSVKNAAARIQAAQQAVPGGTIPYIQPAVVQKARAGIFTNLLVGGVMSQAVMMSRFGSSKTEVESMLSTTRQAAAWLHPKAQEAQREADRLGAQLQSVNVQLHAADEAALAQAMAASSIGVPRHA